MSLDDLLERKRLGDDRLETPAGGVDDSPSGSYHMAGGAVPEWLKGPVSKTSVAVARFGLIDEAILRDCPGSLSNFILGPS